MKSTFTYLLIAITVLGFNTVKAQDIVDQIATKSCNDMHKLSPKLSKDEAQQQLGLSIIKNATPFAKQLKKQYNIDIKKLDEKGGQALGELVGPKLAKICPETMSRINGPKNEEQTPAENVGETSQTTINQQTDSALVDDQRFNQESIPTLTISDDELKDQGTQNVSSSLGASRDAFSSAASFVFSSARFKIRGYDQENFTTYMNGIPVNYLDDGAGAWSLWGGLNSVTRNREGSIGIDPTTFGFGGIGGSSSIDSRASKQRKQLEVSYAATNRTYRNRLMASYSSGIIKKGWAISAAFSRRWAAQGYVPGTFYDGYSYFLSVEKYFGNNHSLSLTAFGAPTRTGKSGAATQEMFNLAGTHYYNPDWGYQDGKVRNANVGYTHQPLFILAHEWKIDNKSSLYTSAGFTFGIKSSTALDWNNAPDPRPDYYRYLPSYIEDSATMAVAEKAIRDDQSLIQINWNNLYDANYQSFETVDSIDGIPGNTLSGKRARYIVENRIESQKRFNLASTYNKNVNDHISVSAGITYQMQITEFYKKVEDLLGADFYVDVNQFAIRDFPDSFSYAQNDLNHPNRILKEGDKFGYDYVANIHRAGAWGQGVFRFNKVDFFFGTELSFTSFWRDGKTKNGLFPNNSFGKSEVQNFFNYAFKGGVTYKANGRNYLYANAEYMTRAPYFENAFVSPRTRNEVANNLQSEQVYSVEGGYKYTSPRFKFRATMYYTQFNNQTNTITYYHGDLRTLVNYTLTGINTRHWGGELGAELKVYKGFSVSAAASMGRYTYISRPNATITQDNNQTVVNNETVYAKGFNVGGTPQLAYTFGISYRDPKFWFVNVNFNYYDWMWLSFSPARRTEAAVDLLEPGTEAYNNIFNQERLKGQFMMDISVGYSWLLNNQFKSLKKRHYLVFNATVNNVTNNKNMITGGYEQLRFDYLKKDPNTFPSKYYYAYGATYFVSVAYRFQ